MDSDLPVNRRAVSLDRKGFDMFVARAILDWNTPTSILNQMKWSPTTNIEHAMIVFKKMCSVEAPWNLFEPQLRYSKSDDTEWRCNLFPICRVDDADMGLAICLTAASVKGYDIHLDENEPKPRIRITVLEAYGDYIKECNAVAEKDVPALLSYDELCGRCARWLSDNGENVTQHQMVAYYHDPLLMHLQAIRSVLKKRNTK